MNDPGTKQRANPRRAAAQLAGLVLGPVSWAAHQNLSYALVPWVCGGVGAWVFAAVTLGAIVVAGGAGFISFKAMPATARTPDETGTRRQGRGRLLGGVSLAFALLSIAGILMESMPILYLDPCAGVS